MRKRLPDLLGLAVSLFLQLAAVNPKYNPQNEMFASSKTKRSIRKNETYLKSQFFKKFSTRLRRVS